MSNSKDTILEHLRHLGLSRDEALIYLHLLEGPSTHLQLARATNVNRTKVYRLADQLEKRSLISTRTDDRGSFLIAADPTTLEVALVTQEEKLRSQRQAFADLLPSLRAIHAGTVRGLAVHAYDGVDGLKQMLWHELKTKNEILIFGSGTIDELIGPHESSWAEKHRARTVEAGYSIREVLNPGDKAQPFTKNTAFLSLYQPRYLPAGMLTLHNQICIYNDTVATYHWRNQKKVGVEVVNAENARMMRQIFEHYWRLSASA